MEKLPQHVSKRILEKFDEIIIDPFRYLEHFEGVGYKLRIGEYRALSTWICKITSLKSEFSTRGEGFIK